MRREGIDVSNDGAVLVTLGSGSVIPSPTFTGTATFSGTSSGFASGDASNPGWGWAADNDGTGTGAYRRIANTITYTIGGSPGVEMGVNLRLPNNRCLAWNSGTNAFTAADDAGITRIGAAAVGVGNGGAQDVSGLLRAAVFSTSIPVTETAATHTVATTTSHLICDRATAVTVTLPAAASFAGRQLWIRAIQAGTVVSAASDVVPRIGGSAGTAIIGAVDGGWVFMVSDGTAWQIMAGS